MQNMMAAQTKFAAMQRASEAVWIVPASAAKQLKARKDTTAYRSGYVY
jgi:hypothetical protein